ncbi:hypothetical protein O1L55_20160, partial [Streptomyces albulus]|nr:hypothetical protein [Streptomyces noursei]
GCLTSIPFSSRLCFRIYRETLSRFRAPFKNDATGTGTVTRRAAVMTIISATQRGKFIEAVKHYWKDKGM